MNSDREARKKALEAAKERLAYRRKQKEQLQLLRQQKQSGGNTGFENRNDYGKRLVADTKQLISDWTSTKVTAEEEEKKEEIKEESHGSGERADVPGPRADLNIVNNINTCDLVKRLRVEYVKEIQTDSVEIGQHSGIITEQTNNTQLNEILATFIENDIFPYPNKKDEIYKRITISEEKKGDDRDEKKELLLLNDETKDETKDDETKDEEATKLILSNEEATKLISSSTFIESFREKSLFLESALGINEEHSIFIEASSTILGGHGNKQHSQMEKLIKSAEISLPFTLNRAITCLEYDNKFGDRFLVSYSGHYFHQISESKATDSEEQQIHSVVPTSNSNKLLPDGLINIFDFQKLNIIKTLECQSMINVCVFHPTKSNMIIGASVSGQVLGWDLRLNKKTPTIRTDFSSSSHTQPIFALNFLPNHNLSSLPSNKIQQILTLSNDAKLCVWRDDMLYKPNNEFLLKLSKHNTTNSGHTHTQTQAKEITTTCISYNNTNPTDLYFGSDEGYIYQCKMKDLNSHKTDEKELSITSYISNAHYGPITCIDFHKQYNLYLTSSFDWTVKLWHANSGNTGKCLSLFNNMQDYIYDVKWSPTNPSIFACGDGSGNLTIFDLNNSFEHPASEPTNIRGQNTKKQVSITKILWSPNGKKIIVGDSNGKISIFDCPVYDSVDNDFDKFEAIIKRKLDSTDR